MALPAGFDINVKSMPHDTYLANYWRKGNFYMAYWGMRSTPDGAFTLLLTSDASYEEARWNWLCWTLLQDRPVCGIFVNLEF